VSNGQTADAAERADCPAVRKHLTV